jgi:hypothetical protein
MPGVQLFGRTLPLASDDFALYGLWGGLLSFILLVVTSVLYNVADISRFDRYLLMAIILSILSGLVSGIVVNISLRGTIADGSKREDLTRYLKVEFMLIFLHFCLQVYGSIQSHIKTEETLGDSYYIIVFLIYIYLTCYFVLIITLLVVYFASPPAKHLNIDERNRYLHRSLNPLFITTHYYNRNSPVSPKDVLSEVAAGLNDLIGDDELAFSDVVVGLYLVRKREAGFDSNAGHIYCTNTTNNETHLNVSTICYLSRYAEAMYGAPLHLYSRMMQGFINLCFPTRGVESPIHAIERTMDHGWAKILCCFPASWSSNSWDHPDLIYKSLRGWIFKSPFIVSVDQKLNAIVIAIRGTLSTTDILVDLYFKETKIKWVQDNQEKEAYTHKGILHIAENIFSEMMDNGIYELINERYSNHQIIFTGHSLGGGVASLLAFMLKNEQERLHVNPRIYAVCYSTPGCMISESALDYFTTFCTSVVLGDDLIARFNPRNIHMLRNKLSYELRNCHLRKVDLLSAAVYNTVFDNWRTNDDLATFYPEFDDPNVNESFIPGNVLHLKAIVEPNCDRSKDQSLEEDDQEFFQPFWVEPKLFGRAIVVSTSMAIDHFPNRIGDFLRKIFPGDV